MKRRTVQTGIIEKKGRVALWLLLSAGVGFFAPLKSFILQWIIDSDSVERALLCLLGGVLVTVASHVLELGCRRAYTKLACGAMADIRRRVMAKALRRSMEKAQGEEDAAYISALTADLRTLYDEYFTPLFSIVFWGAIGHITRKKV
ncbi:MAG: ABC transporter ATP-binding protein [Clostridia bacterium]|nr:ABC transporter ATP-binding protein [Clostridia bacterium]